MKLSFDWLSDYVDLSGITPQEVADKLTMGAFEVEEVRKVGGDLEGPLVVGEILAIDRHPNADKIRLTKVRIAENQEPLEIVCGAQNIEVGQIIPVALPGARVINRHDGTPLAIKVSSIRGVQSNGMLCSPPELGIAADPNASEGILVLSKNSNHQFPLGADIQKILDLTPDWVFYVEPRSNRGDAMSVIGLAREVAALLKRPLKQLDWQLQGEMSKDSDLNFSLKIESTADCPFFSVRVISGIKIGPSPIEIKKRLEAIGVRSVNNVVDITNYVMQELGQPLHAYDLRKINGQGMVIRRAKKGEKITTLDDKERELTDEVLIIADEKGPVGMPIMGGKNTEISDDTTTIVLEAASFNPMRVRRGSRLLGLSSDSCLRFERGIDVAGVAHASDHAASLLLKYCSGLSSTKYGALVSAGSDKVGPVEIKLRLAQVKRLLEIELSPQQIKELLEPLGFTVRVDASSAEPSVTISVPSFRQSDVTREIDIIEELCRLWGYDNIPMSMPSRVWATTPPDKLLRRTREALTAQGLNEALISSLVSPEELARATREIARGTFGLERTDSLVRVLNPLSEDHQALRQSLVPGLLRAAAYNHDRGRKDISLFEIGRVYEREPQTKELQHGETAVAEHLLVGGIIIGERSLSEWQEKSHIGKESDDLAPGFYAVKGIVENLFSYLNIDPAQIQFVQPKEAIACLHPARSSRIIYDKTRGKGKESQAKEFGWLGELRPDIQNALGLRQAAHLFEFNLEVLDKLRTEPKFTDIPTTPPIARDLTVDLPQSEDHRSVQTLIEGASGPILQSLELVSIYKLSDTQKSVSYRLTFQKSGETLTTEEVEKALSRVRDTLKTKVSASFRA